MAFTHEPVLYTRPGCHLCDQVVVMLRAMEAGFTPVDIENDEELERKYGLQIPVLRLPETVGENGDAAADTKYIPHTRRRQGRTRIETEQLAADG